MQLGLKEEQYVMTEWNVKADTSCKGPSSCKGAKGPQAIAPGDHVLRR
jgi:hypothetical protein